MKRRTLWAVFILFVFGMALTGTVSATATPDSGTCGENVTWTLDADGTLTISGTGDMVDTGLYSIWFYDYSEKIKNVIISSGVTRIGINAFSGCSSLESITIPDSVTSIGIGAFQNCSSLKSITIPDSVTDIGFWAFNNCSSLSSATIPNSVTTIGGFQGCSSLSSLGIPNSVTTILAEAFSGCSSLTCVTIPDSVTFIGLMAFSDCDSLTDVYYGGSESQWKQLYIDEYNDDLLNATIHYNSSGPDETNPSDPVVCGQYASDYTTGISFDGSDFTFTLSSLGDKPVPENITVLQIVYDKSGRLVSVTKLSSTKDSNSDISFEGSVSVAGGQKCSMFVLYENSAPMIEKYMLS